MLTVKIVFPNGQESLFSAKVVNWNKAAACLTADDTCYELSTFNGKACVYVTNEFGATVATYY